MTSLRVQIECFCCNRLVSKSESLLIKSTAKSSRYSCSECFKKNKRFFSNSSKRMSEKKELYCERCKYNFISKSWDCPYCNKPDLVSEANITISDLL